LWPGSGRFSSIAVAVTKWMRLTALQTTSKLSKKVKGQLDASYSYLGGNAFGRDKKGRIKQDDSSVTADIQAAGHLGEDYTAYVFYEFEIL